MYVLLDKARPWNYVNGFSVCSRVQREARQRGRNCGDSTGGKRGRRFEETFVTSGISWPGPFISVTVFRCELGQR